MPQSYSMREGKWFKTEEFIWNSKMRFLEQWGHDCLRDFHWFLSEYQRGTVSLFLQYLRICESYFFKRKQYFSKLGSRSSSSSSSSSCCAIYLSSSLPNSLSSIANCINFFNKEFSLSKFSAFTAYFLEIYTVLYSLSSTSNGFAIFSYSLSKY